MTMKAIIDQLRPIVNIVTGFNTIEERCNDRPFENDILLDCNISFTETKDCSESFLENLLRF